MADGHRVLELLRELLVEETPPAAPLPAYMDVAEYAEHIRSTAPTVRELCRDGLPHVRPRPRMIRIDVPKADLWLRERSRSPSGRTVAQKGRLE